MNSSTYSKKSISRSPALILSLLLGILLAGAISVYATSIGTNLWVAGSAGIASTSPWGLFSINPNGISGPSFVIGSSTKTDLVVTNAGNVGIGTTSPATKLHVTAGDIRIQYDGTIIGNGQEFSFSNPNGPTAGRRNLGLKWSNETGGNYLGFRVRSDTFSSAGDAMRVSAANFGVGVGPITPLATLHVSNASGVTQPLLILADGATEYVRVTQAGNVGIGTTSPSSLVHLSAAGPALRLESTTSGINANTQIIFSHPNALNANQKRVDIKFEHDINGGPALQFRFRDDAGNIIGNPLSLNGVNNRIGINTWGNTQGSSLTVSGNISIGAGYITTAAPTDGMIIQGNVGIGTTSPWRTFSAVGTVGLSSSLTSATTGNYLCINTSSYEVTSGTTCSASSERYKEDIATISYGLQDILSLRPVSFKYKESASPNDRTRKLGFIAEEVAPIFPELVPRDKDGNPESVDYAKMVPILTRAIQELNSKMTGQPLTFTSSPRPSFNPSAMPALLSALGTWSIDEQGTLIAVKIITDEVVARKLTATDAIIDRLHAKQVCIGDTCLTESELKSLLSLQTAVVSATTPPVQPPPSPSPRSSGADDKIETEAVPSEKDKNKPATTSPPAIHESETISASTSPNSTTAPLFDVSSRPASGTSSLKFAIAIVAAIGIALGAVVIFLRRG